MVATPGPVTSDSFPSLFNFYQMEGQLYAWFSNNYFNHTIKQLSDVCYGQIYLTFLSS